MKVENLSHLTMTVLERRLKDCFLQRPDVAGRVLTAEELSDYIGWMASEYGGKPGYRVEMDSVADLKSRAMRELGRRILTDPGDAQALKTLSEGYRNQREERYIVADHDVSVARVLRYMPGHWHTNEYFEVFYCFSGECDIYFPNEVIRAAAGTVIIVPPDVVHANPCLKDDAVLLYYMLRASTFEQVFWNQIPSGNLLTSFFRRALDGKQPNAYLHFETGGDAEIRRLMERIYEEFLAGEPYGAQMMNNLMSLCFTLLLRHYEGTARLPRTGDFFWKHEYSAILSYIQTNFATLRQGELAERFHYSTRQLNRIVFGCTGESYSDLIIRLRMEKAAALLRRGGLPMDAVASACGYSTVSSFYRTFSDFYGVAPGRFLREAPETA